MSCSFQARKKVQFPFVVLSRTPPSAATNRNYTFCYTLLSTANGRFSLAQWFNGHSAHYFYVRPMKYIIAFGVILVLIIISMLLCWQLMVSKIKIDCSELGKNPEISFHRIIFPVWNYPEIEFGASPDISLNEISTSVGIFNLFSWKSEIVASS